MKIKVLKIAFLIFLGSAFLFLQSCSKYEEGGGIIFKKGKLCQEWEFDSYEALGDEEYGEDESDYIDSYEETLTFGKDGSYKLEIKIEYEVGDDYNTDYEGTWEFFDDKNFIRVVYTYESGDDEYGSSETVKIIKLKKDELILESYNGMRITYKSGGE